MMHKCSLEHDIQCTTINVVNCYGLKSGDSDVDHSWIEEILILQKTTHMYVSTTVGAVTYGHHKINQASHFGIIRLNVEL